MSILCKNDANSILTYYVKHSQKTELQVAFMSHRYRDLGNKKSSSPALYRCSQDQYQAQFHLLIFSIVGAIHIAGKVMESIVIKRALLHYAHLGV